MAIPQVGADGVRQTVNTNISNAQKVWNLRSGLNVAALNCQRPQHLALVDNYRNFLKKHARQLASVNRTVGEEYRKRFGASYRSQQDSYMTRVYNYFALPPALPRFCDVALSVSNELQAVATGQLDPFAAHALPQIEAVFEDFFHSYEQYRLNLADWDARYGPSVSNSAYGPATSTLEAQYPVSRPEGGQ